MVAVDYFLESLKVAVKRDLETSPEILCEGKIWLWDAVWLGRALKCRFE